VDPNIQRDIVLSSSGVEDSSQTALTLKIKAPLSSEMLGNVRPTSVLHPRRLESSAKKITQQTILVYTICHLFNNLTPLNNVTGFLYARWLNQEISSPNLEEIPKIPRRFHDFTQLLQATAGIIL
jgi:hypothetical protein